MDDGPTKDPQAERERRLRLLSLWKVWQRHKSTNSEATKETPPPLRLERSGPAPFAPKPEMEPAPEWPEDPNQARQRESWLLPTLCLVLGTAWLATFAWWNLAKPPIVTEAEVTASAGEPVAETDAAVVDGVANALASFLRAANAEQQLPWVRDPARVEPLLRDHWRRHPSSPDTGSALRLVARHEVGPLRYYIASTASTSGQRQFLVFPEASGYRVDWETAVVYNPMDWRDFLATKPTAPLTFRVYATPGEYYNYEFEDRAKWTCLELTTSGGGEALFGYYASDMAGAARLRKLIRQGQSTPLMLELHFPAANARNQVIITRLANESWLIKP